MTSTIPARIEELRQTITRAILNYEIWWAYKSSDTRPKFVDVMNKYQPFFVTAIHAHFVALLVALYSLYETRRDTHNIPQLLKELESEGKLGRATLESFQQHYLRLKPIWVKVSILRNDAFGHRSFDQDMAEVFRSAGVSPNELRDLIDGTKLLLNDISLAHDRSFHAFNSGAFDQAVALLEALKSSQGAA